MGLFEKRSICVYISAAVLGTAAETAFHIEANLNVIREPQWLVVAALATAAFVVYFAINLILAVFFSITPFLRSLEARTITVAASALALPHFIYLVTVYAPFPPAGRGALYVFVVVITPLAMAALVHILRHPPVGRVTALLLACAFIVTLGFFLVPRLLDFGTPGRPNVLLITLDAVRPDHLAVYGYETTNQPNISTLGADGLVIGATCEIPVSGPSHATIMTSLDVQNHGITFNGTPLGAETPTLAELFKSEGYATAAFVGGSPLWARDSGFDRGFNHYDDATAPTDSYTRTPLVGRHLAANIRILRDDDNTLERPADDVTNAAVKWLDSRRNGPFFLWVNYYDAHDDYLPPAKFAPENLTERDTQKEVNKAWAAEKNPPPELAKKTVGLYDGEIAFIDSEIGRLLGYMEEGNTLQNTIICIVGAYGEALGEHGDKYHGFNVYQEDIRVPLIFYDGGADLPELKISDRYPVSTLDAAPSLLDLAGIRIPDTMQGRSVFAGGPDREYGFSAAIPDPARVKRAPYKGVYAVYNPDGKLMYFVSDSTVRTEYYDPAEDPAEIRNLADEKPENAEKLSALLNEYIKSFPN